MVGQASELIVVYVAMDTIECRMYQAITFSNQQFIDPGQLYNPDGCGSIKLQLMNHGISMNFHRPNRCITGCGTLCMATQ